MNGKQFGEWLKQLRAAHISREEFVRKYKFHRNTVKNYENEGRLPDIDHLFFLSIETGYSFQELVKQRMVVAQNEKQLPADIDVRQVCEPKAAYIANAQPGEPGQLKQENDTMAPTIQKGATVTYDPSNNELRDGHMYLLRLGEARHIRRIQIMTDSGVMLICDNQAFPPQLLSKEQAADLSVIGAVTSVTNFY